MARSYSATLTWERAMALIERNDARVRWADGHEVPFAYFSRGGTFEWIFMEDARSFNAKLGVVDQFGLRGFSVRVLGYEDPGGTASTQLPSREIADARRPGSSHRPRRRRRVDDRGRPAARIVASPSWRICPSG
jgi:hypothetical protein